jgi:hypothetical protein
VQAVRELDFLALDRASGKQNGLLEFEISVRFPFAINLERFAQPLAVLRKRSGKRVVDLVKA